MSVRLALLLSVVLSALPAVAAPPDDGRPDEGAMFGEPAPAAKPAEDRDARELSPSSENRDKFASDAALDNPLQIGGRYYQRLIISGQRGGGVRNAPLSLPTQFDGFLDARPNDRLRGFIDARLLFDPTRDEFSQSTAGGNGFQFSSTSAAPTSLSAPAVPNNPRVVLDQAWLKFDLGHTAFMTVGRQHVKWGASRFWNPTDFLHTEVRDPLLTSDLRLGNGMAKMVIPLGGQGSNLYAIALFDNPAPASTLGQVGGAFRGETVLGNTEIGAEAVFRASQAPVYGADISTPLGPLDAYAEVALLMEPTAPIFGLSGTPTAGQDLSTLVTQTALQGPLVQASGGASYSFSWRDSRLATIGLEYFYNQPGYSDSSAYPVLIFFGQYRPFYTGKHYAGLYLTAEGPDSGKHTSYTFSTLGNLADHSYISRLDFSWNVLTHLTFEAYGDVHFGKVGGEFNFALETPTLASGTTQIPAIHIPPTFFDLGLGLRLSF